MYTPEIKEKIINSYLAGQSINSIAKENNTRWESVKNLLVREGLYTSIKRNNCGVIQPEIIRFEEINTAEDAYWLGFLYADGCVRSNENRIQFVLKEEDKETVQAFHDYCGNQNELHYVEYKNKGKVYGAYSSTFSSSTTKQNLINLGCIPKKSLILKCPSEEQVPDKFLLDFFRGYIDGDGYIQYDSSKHRYRIVIMGTEEFLKGMVERLEIQAYSTITKTSCKASTLTLSHKEFVYDFLALLYDNNKPALKRKKEIFLKAKQARQQVIAIMNGI